MATPDDKARAREAEKTKNEQAGQSRPLWPWLLGGVIVAAIIIAVLLIIFLPTANVWTNDARIKVHYATIAPRISGQVDAVAVHDYEPVRAGQLLVRLGARQQQAAMARARATIARDRAQLGNSSAAIARQPALIAQARAQVAAARAPVGVARANVVRYRNLAASGAATVRSRQVAEATLRADLARLAGATASLAAARQQLHILHADQAAAHATLQSAQATLAQARLNLSYTSIKAPIAGIIAERSVQVGNQVSAGAALMAIIPLAQIYVQANYLEVALRHVEPGQRVRIHVNAYDIDLRGTVQSIGPATGATFAPIAPENATGNFTKIAQRLPVRIAIDPNQPLARLLRVGMSVDTTIHTHLAHVVEQAAHRS